MRVWLDIGSPYRREARYHCRHRSDIEPEGGARSDGLVRFWTLKAMLASARERKDDTPHRYRVLTENARMTGIKFYRDNSGIAQ